MEIIMPCAGLSTRFPNLRPKYLLTDYNGRMMIENAAKNFLGKHGITVVILKEHDIKFNASQKLKDKFGDQIRVVILEHTTMGPADTIYQAINQLNLDLDTSILVKDCDGFYDADVVEGNIVYVSKLSKNPNIQNASAKSYTISNEQMIINTIVEKQIVSDSFCVGGYQFARAGDYIDVFTTLKSIAKSEIFVSNIIDYMISNGGIFFESEVANFVDVGTAKDWFEYNNKPTYFCDIDGTIVLSNDDYLAPYKPLQHNVDILKQELVRGCKIVFCSARPERYRDITKKMLDELGFTSYELILDVHHARRVLINDYANTNPYPSATAINVKRDDDSLGDLI